MTFEKALTAKPELSGVSGSIAGEMGANAGNSLAVDGGTPWQPIETAPRDGTIICVWADGRCYFRAYWGRKDQFGRAPWGDVGWQGCGGNQPTHWQPLPPAPEAGQ